jgi:hypothetical protein
MQHFRYWYDGPEHGHSVVGTPARTTSLGTACLEAYHFKDSLDFRRSYADRYLKLVSIGFFCTLHVLLYLK